MGATTGRTLYRELRDAAARGVHIRILQAPGFAKSADGQAARRESDDLHDAYPEEVAIREIAMGDWYGGSGIMHQKLWVIDGRHVYIGSANIGLEVHHAGQGGRGRGRGLPRDRGRRDFALQCMVAVRWADTGLCNGVRPRSRDYSGGAVVVLACPRPQRKPRPLAADETTVNLTNRMVQDLGGEEGTVVVSGAPDEVRGPGRAGDGEARVDTIRDARKSVCVSVMDCAPVGLYGRRPLEPAASWSDQPAGNTPVWWPLLFDALLSAVLTWKVWVRLLVSQWAHTSRMIEPYLRALQQAADAGRCGRYLTAVQLEIKQFEVPGWNVTSGTHRPYPGHTRVNHTKYIVTDRRLNIGTSNMTWDYFSSSAGTSFNADHPGLVSTLQAIFERDWTSAYAHRLP